MSLGLHFCGSKVDQKEGRGGVTRQIPKLEVWGLHLRGVSISFWALARYLSRYLSTYLRNGLHFGGLRLVSLWRAPLIWVTKYLS